MTKSSNAHACEENLPSPESNSKTFEEVFGRVGRTCPLFDSQAKRSDGVDGVSRKTAEGLCYKGNVFLFCFRIPMTPRGRARARTRRPQLLVVSRAIRICVRTLGARAGNVARARKGGVVKIRLDRFSGVCAGMLAEPIRLQTE